MKQDIALKILKSGENVFLTGSAGTGKTYVVNAYIKYLRERGIEPAIVAPTGIAASHIGGKTIHSFFSVGIREFVDDNYVSWLTRQTYLQARMRDLKVLIVDEISMVSPGLFFSMDSILRAFKKIDKPFGGVQVIFSGDFFQLPPIVREKREIKFVWQTDLWKEMNLRICYLEEKFRQEDSVLINILEEIRSGGVSEESMEIFRSCYKRELSNKFRPTKLYTHNVDVDRMNEEELDKISGEAQIFEATAKGSKVNIEKILKSSLVVEKIGIKKGAMVIFIKNNYEKGYINGTLGKVVSFSKNGDFPVVEIFSGRKIVADQDEWILEDDGGKVKAVLKQIPLRLAWALTVHKSQGMSLDAAEIDLSKTFEIGQGYVALSRIRSIEGLRLMGLNDVALKVDEAVLAIDNEMKGNSRLNVVEFENLDKKEIEENAKKFILENGGTNEVEEIQHLKMEMEKLKKEEKVFAKTKAVKGETIGKTKELLEKKKTVIQIARERGLSPITIVGHITQIKKLLPDVNIDYLKPEKKILDLVLTEAKKLKKKNDKDNFTEDGELRLKPIFENLNKKVPYDDIRLAMLFLGEKS